MKRDRGAACAARVTLDQLAKMLLHVGPQQLDVVVEALRDEPGAARVVRSPELMQRLQVRLAA